LSGIFHKQPGGALTADHVAPSLWPHGYPIHGLKLDHEKTSAS